MSLFRFTAAALLLPAALFAQQPAPAPATTVATQKTLTDSKAQLAAFVAKLHAAGFTCPIAPPTVIVEDVPSFGQYNSEHNTLRTSDWTLLRPAEHGMFLQLGHGDEAAAHHIFDVAAHQWIFIHELGHWWQACRGGNTGRPPYTVEFEANRVSLAYWREVDPSVVSTMIPVFQGVVAHAPNPVPEGQSVETYFNTNYETLGPSPAYPWFMSRMNVAAAEETPAPTFAQALATTRP